MKIKYYIIIFALFIALGIPIFILKGYLDFADWVSTFGTFGAIFAALTAGIIALGSTDKSPRFVDFTVKIEVNKAEIEPYDPLNLPNELKKRYGNKPFQSYQVYFKIKNISNFSLKNPVITFRLSNKYMHPHFEINKWIPFYRSNFYNVQIDLRTFQYEDVIVLSNTIFPYMNKDDEIAIWIRMCLKKDDSEPRTIFISLNSDNAEGKTKEENIIPSELLKDIN